MAIAGYAALLPTLLSLTLLAAAYVGIRAQAAAEEAYLGRTYGDAYRDYARKVGRFLPGRGAAAVASAAPDGARGTNKGNVRP
jgi:protein-S-isoprenylcysteine O-methyltransferase Ste14